MLWLLLAPLAPGLIGCLWALSRERDLRLALVASFLAALVGRQFLDAPPEGVSFAQLALGQHLNPLLVDFATNALASLASIAITRSILERNRAEQALWNAMEAFRALATFFDKAQPDSDKALDDLLSLGCKHLRLEIGLVSRIAGDEYEIVALQAPDSLPLAQGDRLTLSNTLCCQVMERDQLIAIESTAAARWRHGPDTTDIRPDFGSYIGMPVRLGDKPFGTLCFASSHARSKRFGGIEKQLLELMAHWVGGAIAQREAWRGLDVLARRQQASIELSKGALAAQPVPLTESLERIALALDAPFAAVLRPAGGRSQGEDGSGLLVAAGVGWREGTIGSTVPDADSCFDATLVRGETVAVADFAQSDQPRLPAFYADHGIVATACVPIASASADQPVGVLAVCATQARSFQTDELDFLRLSANLLASAWSGPTTSDPVAVARRRVRSGRPTQATQRSSAVDRRRLRVDASVSELEESLRHAAGPGVVLVLDLSASTSEVRIFGYEFERILWSLVFQAAELAGGEGELRIETRRLASNATGTTSTTGTTGTMHSSFVTLSVQATNARLDDDAMSSLLDRDDVTTAPPSRGGTTPIRRLSLPRIRRLLRAVGGDISSHSGEGEGTTLTSYLPALPLAGEQSATGKAPPMKAPFAGL